jgi:hypothetical protein
MATTEAPVFDTTWPGVHQRLTFWSQNAETPQLREHYRRELLVCQPTFERLGITGAGGPPPVVALVEPPPVGAVFTEVNGAGVEPPPLHVRKTYVPPSGEGSRLSGNIPAALLPLKDWIEAASAKTGVPANLIAAMIWQESRGAIHAVSINSGNGLTDVGLLQINPNTYASRIKAAHPELGDARDPANNIMAGAWYMVDLKERFGTWELALRAYNSGENGVDMNNPHATPAGTGDPTYVTKVMSFWATLDSGQGELPP